jgi:hypothetical protein
MQPQFPVFIPSKDRAGLTMTPRALDWLGVPYRLVVEEQQRPDYERHFRQDQLITLDPAYQRDYDTFDDLGDTKSKGPGPARNFIWDLAVAEGAAWHWVMDDNIRLFARLYHNRRTPAGDGTIFYAMEDFARRYRNVAMAGPNYWMFAANRQRIKPFVVGTRIYSCNLIRNDVPFRWRGRYNEDTDLSLRMLKAGWATLQFNAFLQFKMPTQVIRGGNTEAFYAREGTRPKSEMIVAMHPDVARLTFRFKRVHHYVDYSRWKNKIALVPDPDYTPPDPAVYDMRLEARPAYHGPHPFGTVEVER